MWWGCDHSRDYFEWRKPVCSRATGCEAGRRVDTGICGHVWDPSSYLLWTQSLPGSSLCLEYGNQRTPSWVSVVCRAVTIRGSDDNWECSGLPLYSSIVGLSLLMPFPLLLVSFWLTFQIPKETTHTWRTYFGSWLQRNQSMAILIHYFYNHGKEETSGKKDRVKDSVSLHSIQETKGKNQKESGSQSCLKSKCPAALCLQLGILYSSTNFYSNFEFTNGLNLWLGQNHHDIMFLERCSETSPEVYFTNLLGDPQSNQAEHQHELSQPPTARSKRTIRVTTFEFPG